MQNKMWMVGMMLIAFFVGLMFSQNTTAQQGQLGRYQIRNSGTAIAWRVDTVTGQVSRCQTIISQLNIIDHEDPPLGCLTLAELGVAIIQP
jgi:hypothetical protein